MEAGIHMLVFAFTGNIGTLPFKRNLREGKNMRVQEAK